MNFKDVPKNIWLSPKELQKYGLPGFWKLDKNSGTWIDSVVQILDEVGRYKFNFR
jgi:hypothetical protein